MRLARRLSNGLAAALGGAIALPDALSRTGEMVAERAHTTTPEEQAAAR